MVCNIWLDVIHTLKGELDCLIGHSDAKVAQFLQFITLWKDTPLLSSNDSSPLSPFQHFQPPSWLLVLIDHMRITPPCIHIC